ncbi:D-ribose ABC transporter substrate-binding protein [Tepidanaerobacter syntrophicus]|uniref:sugar ABC transporter substrate-binding protein n=1 Tax=Tepidanaerobacter syntrophicus TaxID=224999 RepID=UPI0022EEDC5C|nr:sugar ABC transporter substrate-binding protein [Tepidanaerobacter syntrophicus]GLI18274.1 D-ribose ABC transporter substrate-binding protein [Tepidanaerobacter syntrophicus]
MQKSRIRKSVAICGVAMLLIFTLTACGVSTESPSNAPTSKSNEESNTTTKIAKDPYQDPIKIGFVPNVIGDSVASAWGEGIKRELKYYPNISLQVFDGKASSETQSQIMKDLINQQYDCIILQANDSAALAATVKEAETAGISVITLNLDADTPHAALVAMVDYEAGKLVAEQIAKSIGDKEGNIVIIQAPPGASRGINVEKGFKDEIAKHSNLKILDSQNGEWLTEKGNEVMRDFLTKYPKIDAVFAINDAMAEGASQAAEAAGRLNEMVIWGTDGEKKALEYIEKGKLTGTIYTNCYDQGATAARLALYLIGGVGEIDSSKFTKTPVVKMAPIIVTKDTVGSISPEMRW